MKLRIRDNSIRLRLMRSEVDALRDTGEVTAETRFPDGRSFRYSVASSATADAAGVSFDGDQILVSLPASTVADWAGSEEVSMRGTQDLPGNDELRILVEKDFVCLTGREDHEDESDMYPHPSAGKLSC